MISATFRPELEHCAPVRGLTGLVWLPQWARAVYARSSLRLRQVYSTVTGYTRHRLMQLWQQYKPHLLLLYHHFETHVVDAVRDAISE